MITHDSGVNYYDFTLRNDSGQVKIGDFYIYVSGEHISTMIERIVEMGLPGTVDSPGSPDIAALEDAQKLQLIEELTARGEFEEAYRQSELLPEKFRTDKSVRLMKISIAQQLDDNRYNEALEEFKSSYPDDPSLNLILVDAYLMDEQLDKAMECIDKLDKDVKDPYLECTEAIFFTGKKIFPLLKHDSGMP